MSGAPVATDGAVEWRTGWMQGAGHDVVMALLWVPFVLAALAVSHDPNGVRTLVSLTLLFSFAHQPLTLWLVYGDVAQRRSHASLVLWAPVALAVTVVVASTVRPDVVAIVAAVWNVAHTIRQRYGVCKLYGRLAGIECGGDNRLLWSWLVLAVVVAFTRADLGATARVGGLGRPGLTAIDLVASADAAVMALLPAALLVAVVTTVRWARVELARTVHSRPRLLYLASTVGLLVVLAVHPVAGFVGYVGAHAAEYLFVVRWRISRAAARSVEGDAVGGLARRVGSGGTLSLYAVVVVVLVLGISTIEHTWLAPVIILTLGALHLFFDGVIWRAPRPVPVDR